MCRLIGVERDVVGLVGVEGVGVKWGAVSVDLTAEEEDKNLKPGNAIMSEQHDSKTDNRRQHGRIRCEVVQSSVGRVIDASGGGMRILVRGRVSADIGSKMELKIEADGETFMVEVEIVWVKKRSFFGKEREIGVQFVDVTPQIRAALGRIAQSATQECHFALEANSSHDSRRRRAS